MDKPDTVTINVRQYAGTYIATAKELKVRASCTSGAQEAAHVCGFKLYGPAFSLKKVTDQTFIAEALKTEQKKPGAWHTDLPDDDIDVLVKTGDEALPIMGAVHSAGEWLDMAGVSFDAQGLTVIGWMHLHEAAAILDASSSQPNSLNP